MIIMKKAVPYKYTYQHFLEDFNIDVNIFDTFNSTTDRKKKLYTLISGERTGIFEQRRIKIKDEFEAVFYIQNVRGEDKEVKMDFLVNGDYLFKNVSAQTFILNT